MNIKFYGVRGSVPSPLTGNQVEDKIVQAFRKAKELEAAGFKHEFGQDSDLKWVQNHIQFNVRSTYGGNTTCLEIRCNGYPLIFDMGTGMRELGKAMIPEIIANKGINGTIFQSHLHWDHLQGLPFWAPLFMPRRRFNNNFKFYGGKAWDSKLEDVLKGQMNQPVFPVNLEELQHTAMNMEFETIWDGREIKRNAIIVNADVLARKLFHPQETFGYRVKHGDAVVAFTTDHEPYSGDVVPAGLRELIDGVDIWITDCQYSHENYLGNKDGIQKLGWGHSYPGYIAMVAHECGVKKIITTHHDPSSSDREIEMIADSVEAICDISTEPAYEGMEITL
jgi:phosphoribosyl 1,2-cyclic phosphodiesterase